jgi:hypothetical protein
LRMGKKSSSDKDKTISWCRRAQAAASQLVGLLGNPSRQASSHRLELRTGPQLTFLLPKKSDSQRRAVNVTSVTLRNSGQSKLTRVSVLFSAKPDSMHLLQMYAVSEETQGRYRIVLGELWPDHEIVIGTMTIDAAAPHVISVHSAECVAQEIRRGH